MKHTKLITTCIILIVFIYVGVHNVVTNQHKVELKNIELKSKQAEIIELNQKYDEVIQLKTKTQKEKEAQAKKIKKLEEQRRALQRDLQAKADKQADEAQKLARTAEKVLGTQVASAAGGCADWITQAGISDVSNALELIRRESGCNPNAVNASSGACGIAQELPCGKSGCRLGDGACQVKWMNGYVASRYGSWANAVAFHNANNWY